MIVNKTQQRSGIAAASGVWMGQKKEKNDDGDAKRKPLLNAVSISSPAVGGGI